MSWWIVSIGDEADEKLGDRYYSSGKKYLKAYKLPERKRYVIEDTVHPKSGYDAKRKAIERARADGISRPVWLGSSRTRYQIRNNRIVDL